MPTVSHHPKFESWLYERLGKLLGGHREGRHVSDLLLPRKAYWAVVEPRPASNRELLYYTAGRAHEEVLFRVLRQESVGSKLTGTWNGISYAVDLGIPQADGSVWPIELKTNRRPTVVPAERVIEDYALAVQQLASYAAILDAPSGLLLVFHLMARGLSLIEQPPDGTDDVILDTEPDPYAWLKKSEPRLVAYQIDWTAEEREANRALLEIQKRLLESALAVGDHTRLPECPEWLCGQVHIRRSNPICPMCGTVYTVGEIKPDGKKRGVVKTCETCKVGGHMVGGRQVGGTRVDLVRDSQEIFVPGCRWWESCLPAQHAKYHRAFWKPERTTEEIDEITPEGEVEE